MKALFLKVAAYLQYPSTYKGLVTLATLAGVNVAPDQATAISSLGIAIFGVISVFFSDADVVKPVTK